MNQNCIIEHGIDGNCEMKKHLKIVNTKYPGTIFYLIAIHAYLTLNLNQ